jgi:fumarate hydratase class I
VVATRSSLRKNTKDNTPAVIFTEIVPGNTVEVTVAAKGGGSENKSKMYMLNPSDNGGGLGAQDRADHGRRLVPAGHAGHRHRRHGREGGADGQGKPDGRHRHVRAAGQSAAERELSSVEELRLELYEKVNALGIGAQGLGGLTTVLDVKIKMYPTHAASKPMAMIPNCAATRHAHFVMDGSARST